MKIKQLVVIGFMGAAIVLPGVVHSATESGHEQHTQAAVEHEMAQGEGELNGVDVKNHTVNVKHGAIASLGWPPMVMDFAVGAGVDLQALKVGQKIHFKLMKMADGSYQMVEITPAH